MAEPRAGRSTRRGAIEAGLVGGLAAGLAWSLGVDAGHVAALGLLTAAVAAVVRLVPLPAPLHWPEGEPSTSGTGWHQVALLAAVLAQTDRDPDRIGATRRRLRGLAEGRLQRAGLAWTDPRVRELLGVQLVDVLDGRQPSPRATRLVADTLSALDRLPPPGRGGGTA